MVEAYKDIAGKIDEHQLNFDNPNRLYDGETHEIDIGISESMQESLVRLSVRLLNEWKNQLAVLKRKTYLTNDNQEKILRLENLIWPLEAMTKEKDYVLGKYSKRGPLEFPGEKSESAKSSVTVPNAMITDVFPKVILSKIPKDVGVLCQEFNFNFQNHKPHSCILLLRRMLPLSIVRKFQKLNKESEIKNQYEEYCDTGVLLEKVKPLLINSRIYKEITNYKILLDGSQHFYSLSIDITDTQGAAIAIRCLLDDIFQ